MISDKDLDEMLVALSENGFSMPFMARIADHGREGIAAADKIASDGNRGALAKALESTQAWSRYRIY